jgi:hypothetical protein
MMVAHAWICMRIADACVACSGWPAARQSPQGQYNTGAGHSLLPAVDSPIPLPRRSVAVNGDCLAPCALSCGKLFPARAADRHDGAPSGRAPSLWLCTGSRRLCARKCSVPPRRRCEDVQGASGRIDSRLNTARRRRGFAGLLLL